MTDIAGTGRWACSHLGRVRTQPRRSAVTETSVAQGDGGLDHSALLRSVNVGAALPVGGVVAQLVASLRARRSC
ncbi:hypothetical protein [Streptomyces cyaneofuscatus]|uniref:hypothetical protein n=1 Tax=Streptomyces TaxID=1883 RepID=UPI0037B658E9